MAGGIAQGNAASYNAAVARNNAQIARQNATYSEQAGNAKQEQAGLQAAEQVGAAKTALAANNVDVNTGSALDVTTGTKEEGTLNQYTIQNNEELQAYGYRSQATGFEAQAGLDQAEAGYDPIAGAISGAGSLLSSSKAIGGWGGSGFTASGGTGVSSVDDSIYTPVGPTGFGVGGV